ncbi:hypothetical protein J2X73_001652 [Novosphingobium sp. 1748]|nr:hypothetical protein [Novosphingobium sp. 1748]
MLCIFVHAINPHEMSAYRNFSARRLDKMCKKLCK